jgi:hypothetical protein
MRLWLRTSSTAGVMFLVFVAAACSEDAADTTSPATTVAATTSTPAAPTTMAAPTTLVTTTTQPPATTTAPIPIEETVTGVVIAVEGNLTGIDSFVIRLPDGSDLALVPTNDLLFDGVGPLSHVRDHLVSGNPIYVTYLTSSEGQPIVHAIGDASGDTHDH